MSNNTGGVEATKEDILRIMDRGDWDILLDIVHTRGLRRVLVQARKEVEPDFEEFIEKYDFNREQIEAFETDVFPDIHIATLSRYAYGMGIQIKYDVIPKEEKT